MTAQLERHTYSADLDLIAPAMDTSLVVARPGLPDAVAVAEISKPSRVRVLAQQIWLRAPFTTVVVGLMLLAGAATGSLWQRLAGQSWFSSVGYGVPSVTEGRWWTPITGAFLALNPWLYIPVAGGFAVLVGFTEWRIGTRRTAAITIGSHLLALAVAIGFLLLFRDSGWTWAATVSERLDVGFSTGALAAIAAASAGIRAPWRLRTRVALVLYVVLAFVMIGHLADLLHLIAVAIALPLGPKLIRRQPPLTGRPSRREWRLMAVAGLLLITVSDFLLFFAPSDGPLGITADPELTLLGIVLNFLIVLLLANGLRKGRRFAWWVAIGVAGLSTAAALLLPAAAFVALMTNAPMDADGLPMFIAGRVAWAAVLLVLIIGRRAFRAPSPRRLRRQLANRTDRQTALDVLKASGGSNLSWMSTWHDNRYFVTDDAASVVAYQVHRGVAIAIGDPIGPTDSSERAITEFAADSEKLGLVPAFFSATAFTTSVAVQQGFQQLQIAEDTILDLPNLEFRGKTWQDVRTAINRAAKEGISFRLTRLMDEPYSVVAQLRAISEQWVGDKGLPELGFTLGGVDEALDPEVRVGLATDTTGRVHGVVSWLPVYRGDGVVDGWTLDVMRRRDGAFRPVIEFLIAQSALAFKADGAPYISLSGAPLARTDATAITGLPRVLDTLGSAMEPVYGFRSLHAFKAKFQPRYESMHLLYRDEADLPRIGLALAKAYLPAASMRDMLRVARTAH